MSTVAYESRGITVHHGDCLKDGILAQLPDSSVDAVVTDPPYNLGFMGKEWDRVGGMARTTSTSVEMAANPYGRARTEYGGTSYGGSQVESMRAFQAWCEEWARECLRVLKPGGHMLAFGGTRTWHRLACAVEDAGFEVRDSIAWLYGSGFPKSLDVSKAIDKAAGAEREVIGTKLGLPGYSLAPGRASDINFGPQTGDPQREADITAPATDAARTWQGWGTALKPAFEPIVVARKPLGGNTVAANVLAHGTGALNIDACRIGETVETWPSSRGPNTRDSMAGGVMAQTETGPAPAGRWPANVVLDDTQAAALDEQSGEGENSARRAGKGAGLGYHGGGTSEGGAGGYDDQGGASRFFYVAKADATERVRVNGTAHPTVKPLALMRWLVRLVTPPGGTVLEPFAGSGTTVEACLLEGFDCVAIEREAEYLPLIRQRIARRRDPVAAVRAVHAGDEGLFGLLGGDL